jgi:hypothetical protein
MRDLKKLLSGLLLGLTVVFTGCGDTNYTKGQLSVVLDDGLISSVIVSKGTDKMEAKYKDKKLLSLDFGENSKIEYFDDGKLKYLIFNDKQVKGEIKFNKGEEFPYYFLNEAKPSNSKAIFENDILTLSQLDNQQIFETHKKDSQRTQMVLSQVTNAMKTLANTLSENVYNQALGEISK